MDKPNSHVKRIVLDFDGTIADTYGYYRKTLDELYPHFNFNQRTPEEIENDRNKSFRTIIKENNIPILQVLSMARNVKKKLAKDVDKINLFPGISNFIREMHSKGIQMSIVSINNKHNIIEFLKQVGIDNIITDVWTSNVIFGKHKTLLKLAKKHRINVEDILYIGDEVRDIETCKKIKMRIAAITWGFNSKEALSRNTPDFLADNTEELSNIVARLTNT